MEFTVKFEGYNNKYNSWGSGILMRLRSIGIDDVDRIREELELNIPLERINDHVKSINCKPQIILSEEEVRKAGCFKNRNSVLVKIPKHCWDEEGMIDHCVVEVVECDQNSETGEVTKAYIKRKVDKDKLLKFWEENDYRLDLTK